MACAGKPHAAPSHPRIVTPKHFTLHARVSSADPDGIRPVLVSAFPEASLRKEEGGWLLEADADGESAKKLNRALLSALRRAEKRTRLRAEWTSADGTTERYFDYVLKKTFTK